jgi:hypothetical protein
MGTKVTRVLELKDRLTGRSSKRTEPPPEPSLDAAA